MNGSQSDKDDIADESGDYHLPPINNETIPISTISDDMVTMGVHDLHTRRIAEEFTFMASTIFEFMLENSDDDIMPIITQFSMPSSAPFESDEIAQSDEQSTLDIATQYAATSSSSNGSDTTSQICPICCVTSFDQDGMIGFKVTCPSCLFIACARCIKKSYELSPVQNIFIECVGCGKTSITINEMEKNKILKPLAYGILRPRLIQYFTDRENKLLEGTSELSEFYIRQRIVLSHVHKSQFYLKINSMNLYDYSAIGNFEITVPIASKHQDPPISHEQNVFNIFEIFVKPDPLFEINGNESIAMSLIRSLYEIIRENFSMAYHDNSFASSIILRNIYLHDMEPVNLPPPKAIQVYNAHIEFLDLISHVCRNVPIYFFTKTGEIMAKFLIELVSFHFTIQIYDPLYFRHALDAFIAKLGGLSSTGGVETVSKYGKCWRDTCRGYLHDIGVNLECRLCKAVQCKKCNEPICGDTNAISEHVCDTNIVSNIELIKSTSQPCPKCNIPITKIEGCHHMFCTQCFQPFDWETRALHISNTNPIYHDWLRQIQNVDRTLASPNQSEDSILKNLNNFEILRNVYNTNALGMDGLSKKTRNLELVAFLKMHHHFTLAGLIATIERTDQLIEKCAEAICLPNYFENRRISYLIGDLTKDQWVADVSRRGLTGFLIYKCVLSLDAFSQLAMQEFIDCYQSLDGLDSRTVTARAKIALTLRRCVRLALNANDQISSLFAIGGMVKNRAKNRIIFKELKKYEALFDQKFSKNESIDSEYAYLLDCAEKNPSITPCSLGLVRGLSTSNYLSLNLRSQASSTIGQRTRNRMSNVNDAEEHRVLKIFTMTSEKDLIEWINETVDIS